jgi:hypothetical protein
MLGGFLVIIWLILFSIFSCLFCKVLDIKTVLLRTIFVWTFFMVFIAIFEVLLLFYPTYMQQKSEEYYTNKTCYWTENVSYLDMFSYKMYMDLYADYSLADKRYGKKIENEGYRVVISGEETHAFLCILFVPIIIYYFIYFNETNVYLYALMFVATQFAIITWYLATVCIEMYFVKNEQFWFPPLLWNVPWVIVLFSKGVCQV